MYNVGVGNREWITSGQLQRLISEIGLADESTMPECMRHMSAIESLEARGMRYSNHDFDVLAPAHSFVLREAKRLGIGERIDRLTASWIAARKAPHDCEYQSTARTF
jgi:hypothetical protein